MDVKRRDLSKRLGAPREAQIGEGATMQVLRGPMTILPMREDGSSDLTQKELEALLRRSKEEAASKKPASRPKRPSKSKSRPSSSGKKKKAAVRRSR